MSTTTDSPDLEQTKPGRQAGIWFILVTIFLDVLGLGLIIPVLPELVRRHVADDTQTALWYGVLASVYALMQFLFAPLFGALSDRVGRRPVILLSLLGYGLNYLLLAFAPSLAWLLAARIISGIMGATLATANAYIADVSTSRDRARNFGLIGAAFGLGFIIAPALGGILGSVSIQLPFLAAAGLVLVSFAYGWFVLPESLPADRRRRFAAREADPLGGLTILRRWPVVAGMALVFALFQVAQLGLQNIWVLYTAHRYGWGELANGLSLALVGVGSAVVQTTITPRLIAAWGERRAIVIGMAISLLSFVLYGLASQGWMFASFILIGSLAGVTFPAVQSFVAGNTPSEHQGAVQGALSSLVSMASIIGPLLATGIFGYFTAANAPIQLPGAPFFLGAVFIALSLLWARRLFGEADQPDTQP